MLSSYRKTANLCMNTFTKASVSKICEVKHDHLFHQGNHCLLTTRETFMYTGQMVDSNDINDRQASQGLLLLCAAYLSLTMDPIHPSLSDLTQVPMAKLSHLHRGPRLSAAQDEKTVEALNFNTVKLGFGMGLCYYQGHICVATSIGC